VSADRYVLDTSAILALIENEPGADRVEELLRGSQVVEPFMVLLECYYITYRERGAAEAETRHALLRRSGMMVEWCADEATVLTAGRMKARNAVSLADALIAAFAKQRGAVLVHKDPEYESLAGEVELEPLPYKERS